MADDVPPAATALREGGSPSAEDDIVFGIGGMPPTPEEAENMRIWETQQAARNALLEDRRRKVADLEDAPGLTEWEATFVQKLVRLSQNWELDNVQGSRLAVLTPNQVDRLEELHARIGQEPRPQPQAFRFT